MPTTIYGIRPAGVSSALVEAVAVGTDTGEPYVDLWGEAQWDFVATGTALTLRLKLGGLSGTVDGVPFSANATGNWSDVVVFTGLADGPHTCHVVANDGTRANPTTAWKLTGAAPALGYAAGFGPSFHPQDDLEHVRYWAPYCLQREPVGSRLGVCKTTSASHHLFAIECRAKCSEVWLFTLRKGQKFRLYTDGVSGALATIPNDSTYGWTQLFTGLDTTAYHVHRVQAEAPFATSGSTIITPFTCDLMVVGGSGVDETARFDRPTVLFTGDSITAASNTTIRDDSRQCYTFLVAQALDARAGVCALGGGKMPSAATDIGPEFAPDLITELYGTNDFGGSTPEAEFKANYLAYLTDLRARCPLAHLVSLSILDRWIGGETTVTPGVALYNGYKQAVFDEWADENSSWIVTQGVLVKADTADGLHPTAAGNIKIADFLSPLLAEILAPPPDPSEPPDPNPWLFLLDEEYMPANLQNRLFGNRVKVVAPGAGYSLLSQALADITDAAADNQWLIIVSGKIAETVSITAKSHVSVLFQSGASVTVTLTSSSQGFNFNTIVNSSWVGLGAGPHLIRAGLISANSVATVRITTCDSTLSFTGLNAENQVTHSGSPSQLQGWSVVQSQCRFEHCTGRGAAVGSSAFGWAVDGSACTFTDCLGCGGASAGTNAWAISIFGASSGNRFYRCRFYGGGSGSATSGGGIRVSAVGFTEFSDCEGEGGAATGGGAHGMLADGLGTLVQLNDCRLRGGDGAAANHGLSQTNGSYVGGVSGRIAGGAGGTGCYGHTCTSPSTADFSEVIFLGGGRKRTVTTVWAYVGATPDFVLDATRPLRPFELQVAVITPTSGASVRLYGDAGLTLPLHASAQSIAANGTFRITVTSAQLIAAGGRLYASVTGGSPADGAFTVTVVGEISFGGADALSCAALFPDSDSLVTYVGGAAEANAASNAMHVSTNGRSGRTTWANMTFRRAPLDSGSMVAVRSTATWNNAPLLGCVLIGGTSAGSGGTLTCVSATGNGGSQEY